MHKETLKNHHSSSTWRISATHRMIHLIFHVACLNVVLNLLPSCEIICISGFCCRASVTTCTCYNQPKSPLYTHTHTRTHAQTHLHTYILTYIRTYVRTYRQTDIHTDILRQRDRQTNRNIYMHTYTHTYRQTNIAYTKHCRPLLLLHTVHKQPYNTLCSRKHADTIDAM